MREQARHPAAANCGHGLTAATGVDGSLQPRLGPEHLTSDPLRHRAGSEKHVSGRSSYDCPMAVTLSAMFISVHDPDAALVFYRDALGLEVRADVASEGFRWVTVGAPGQDVDIVLSQPHGVVRRLKATLCSLW